MKFFALFLNFLLLLFCGCSKQMHPPVELSQRIAKADHFVAVNHNGVLFKYTNSESDVSNLAEAVKLGGLKDYGANSDFGNPYNWDIEFYQGTNLLEVMHLLNHGAFQLKGIEYFDRSGVLEKFWAKLQDKRSR